MTLPPEPLYSESTLIQDEVPKKACTKCGLYKPLTEFHRNLDRKDGRISRCKACTAKPPRVYITPIEKVCTRCGGDPQPLENFYKSPDARDGRVSRCKKCVRQDTQDRQQKRHIPEDISGLTKICTKCGTSKPLTDFHKTPNSRDGRVWICKKCRSTKKPKTPKIAPDHKVCSSDSCDLRGQLQPITNFAKSRTGRDGFNARCKSCAAKWRTAWGKKNVDKVRESARNSERKRTMKNPDRFKGLYQKLKGTNPEALKQQIIRVGFCKFKVNQRWFDEKLASQNGRCAICGKDKEHERWARFCIDHDHACCGKGKACEKCRRGLLCHACNIKLGMIEDAEWIAQAVAYLKKHGKDFSRIFNP